MHLEVEKMLRTSGAKFWNDGKYFAQKWWNLVENYFSPEDCTMVLGPSWGLPGPRWQFSGNIVYIFTTLNVHHFWLIPGQNIEIMSSSIFHQSSGNNRWTFEVLSQDLIPNFYKLFFIFCRLLMLISFAIFLAKMLKLIRAYCFTYVPVLNLFPVTMLYESLQRKPGWRFTAGVWFQN